MLAVHDSLCDLDRRRFLLVEHDRLAVGVSHRVERLAELRAVAVEAFALSINCQLSLYAFLTSSMVASAAC